MHQLFAKPAKVLGAALLGTSMLAGCSALGIGNQQKTATVAPPPAPAPAPAPAPPSPMQTMQTDMNAAKGAISARNRSEALSDIDKLQSDLNTMGASSANASSASATSGSSSNVAMSSADMHRAMSELNDARIDVNKGYWTAANRHLDNISSMFGPSGGPAG